MNSLLKKYINNLTVDKINEFGIKNDIYLEKEELSFLLELIKTNIDDILVNESKYLDIIKNKVSEDNYIKIKNLFLYYKNRYKGYLF